MRRGSLIALSLFACSPSASPAPAPAPTSASVASVAPAESAAPPPKESSAPATTSPPPSPAPPRKVSCDDALPRGDMLKDNFAATAMSGIAEVVASSTVPTSASGYVNVRYEVRVLKWFAGSGAEPLVLSQGAETGYTPLAPGSLLFFSACAASDGKSGYEPDVGFFFSVDAACRADVEKRGEAEAKRARVRPGDKRTGRACSKK